MSEWVRIEDDPPTWVRRSEIIAVECVPNAILTRVVLRVGSEYVTEVPPEVVMQRIQGEGEGPYR